jgi:hypothetical protein
MGGGANAENQPQVFKLLRATFRVNAGTTQDNLRQRNQLEIDAESQDLPKR